VAPRQGLEPRTLRLTAECSTIELPGNRTAMSYNFNIVCCTLLRSDLG
jgi:hypothetical protein